MPFVAVLAEDERLAVDELERRVGFGFAFLGVGPGAVVEDVAVLVDLDERGARVLGGPLEHFAQVLDLGVDRAGDERGFAADRDRERMERVVDRAHRRALGLLAERRRGRVLALGEAVDAVVEQDDVDIEVAADGVHQVIAADREAVAVAGDDPDVAGRAART